MPQLESHPGLIFRIKWDGNYVPGITRISPLRRSTAVVTHRDGSTQSTEKLSPGTTTYEPLTLERPRTFNTTFEDWANQLIGITNGVPTPGPGGGFRKDVSLELYSQADQLLMAFHIYRCWPSAYEALSGLDSDGASPILETLTLQNEGWARDLSVSLP